MEGACCGLQRCAIARSCGVGLNCAWSHGCCCCCRVVDRLVLMRGDDGGGEPLLKDGLAKTSGDREPLFSCCVELWCRL
jgi:hypothetical protein